MKKFERIAIAIVIIVLIALFCISIIIKVEYNRIQYKILNEKVYKSKKIQLHFKQYTELYNKKSWNVQLIITDESLVTDNSIQFLRYEKNSLFDICFNIFQKNQ